MAGESGNIAEIAAQAASKIFDFFGWIETDGPKDQNFKCDRLSDHQRETSKTHPVDSVFYYDDVFTPNRQYFLTDFKSYSESSITNSMVNTALREISRAVECASTSREWQDRYVDSTRQPWTLNGLLFVYNHDKKYDKTLLKKYKGTPTLSHPRKCRIFVLSPDRINYLESVVLDLKSKAFDLKFSAESIRFFNPDRVLQFVKAQSTGTSPIETLLGPLQIVSYAGPAIPEGANTSLIAYYVGTGSSTEEFAFLLEYFFTRNLVTDNRNIEIRGVNLIEESDTFFKNAKAIFLKRFFSLPEFGERLNRISLGRAARVSSSFSEIQIGMARRS